MNKQIRSQYNRGTQVVSARQLALAAAVGTLCLQSCTSGPSSQIDDSLAGIVPGYSYLQEITGPGLTREVRWEYSGSEEGLNRWNLFLPHQAGNTPWKTVWVNRSGAMVRYKKDSKIVSWEPHDCFRVVGECEFKYTDSFGFENKFVRNGQFDGNSWTYDLYRVENNERALLTNGEVRFNDFGVEIFHEYHTSNNGYQISRVTEFY